MSFVEDIIARLKAAEETPILQELREGNPSPVTARELLEMVRTARAFLCNKKLKKGDRCALLAHNSIRWIAMDIAIMAEGLVVVPLYARQAQPELVSMMKDCSPSLILCGDCALRDALSQHWREAPPQCLFDEAFKVEKPNESENDPHSQSDLVTIIYTSGTSGEPKGVMLNAGNIGYMLTRTTARLNSLTEGQPGQDRVYHYLPFSFAASHIAVLTYLLRGSLILLNMDLTKIAAEMPTVAADYFLNVPALLERTRKAIDGQLREKGGIALKVFNRGRGAWLRKQEGKSELSDPFWLVVANAIVFSAIRKKVVGPRLKALISGSAPLAVETQLYFKMLGIPVLQVYGLTETTGICTMDDPKRVIPGRVGPAIQGIEMKIGENEEIIIQGPNIFPGYWQRPQETTNALRDGWFHTGDQGEFDSAGNWKIVGRFKNLIILSSGHKFPPEPIEQELAQILPSAQQVMIVGNGRGYLSAILTGEVSRENVQAAVDLMNSRLPHYKQVRGFHISNTPFSIENGLLTANGKLKRDLIAERFKQEIQEMYVARQAS